MVIFFFLIWHLVLYLHFCEGLAITSYGKHSSSLLYLTFIFIQNIVLLPGNIRSCKDAALKCDQLKFEHYKLVAKDQLADGIHQQMQNSFEKIKILEH